MTALLARASPAQKTDGASLRVAKETSLGKLPAGFDLDGPRVYVSADSRHLAYEDSSPEGQAVVFDGVPGVRYSSVTDVLISPDGKRLAYAAARNADAFMVIDRQEGDHGSYLGGTLRFSPDSLHVGFNTIGLCVIDGKPDPYYGRVVSDLEFSPDSRHSAYVAHRHDTGTVVVVDGKEGRHYLGPGSKALRTKGVSPRLRWSPDSARVTYWAYDGAWRLVIRGKEEVRVGRTDPPLPGFPVWNPDGRTLAYATNRGDRVAVVTGASEGQKGSEGRPYERADYFGFSFSRSGTRHGYLAQRQDRALAVVDGVESDVSDAIQFIGSSLAAPLFSPDSRREAHPASRRGGWVVVSDGVDGKPYDGIAPYSLVFSPDSRRLAYAAKRGRHWMAVVDGVESSGDLELEKLALREMNQIQPIAFSPDGRHVGYQARRGQQWMTVVDGIESAPHDGFIGASHVVFDGPTRLHVLIARKGECLVQELELGSGPERAGANAVCFLLRAECRCGRGRCAEPAGTGPRT